MAVETTVAAREPTRGFAFALAAYVLWGALPIYMKAVSDVPPIEVVAYRVVWSVPVAGIVLLLLGRTADLKQALASPRTLGMAAVTAILISINWSIYVWAIMTGHTVETALGYYINPLINVVLGAVLLGERMTRTQIAAVGLAALAVLILTVDSGGLPWVSLGLALCFGFYGFFRKTLPIGPSQGFMLEVLILSVPALCYIGYTIAAGTNHFIGAGIGEDGLLMLAGPLTAGPLLFYGFGAKLLRYSTIGLMQYMLPTFIFCIAVFVFGEPFGAVQLVTFGLIWIALAIYSWPMLRRSRG
jgi:chloramphenicol-sensitive protein RarD